MNTPTYRVRSGFVVRGDPAEIGHRLEELKRTSGQLAPEDVVRDAARKNSPLHVCFEWDDTEAARKYRLEQARYLIRSIEVEYETAGPQAAIVVGVQYVNLGERGAQEPYSDVRDVMSDPALRKRYVAAVLRDLQAIREKYKYVQELADVYAAIDRAAATLTP